MGLLRIKLCVCVVQALNQLFEKIMALDIDERHLLRLGHGEEELETEKDFSRLEKQHSLSVLTPVHLHIHVIICSANRMPAMHIFGTSDPLDFDTL